MQYSQEQLKTMVYAKFGGQTECIMGNSKIENRNIIKDNFLGLFSKYMYVLPIIKKNYPLTVDVQIILF